MRLGIGNIPEFQSEVVFRRIQPRVTLDLQLFSCTTGRKKHELKVKTRQAQWVPSIARSHVTLSEPGRAAPQLFINPIGRTRLNCPLEDIKRGHSAGSSKLKHEQRHRKNVTGPDEGKRRSAERKRDNQGHETVAWS